MAFRSGSYWDLEGTFATARRRRRSPATLVHARRQAPRVGPRLRRRHRSAQSRRRRRAARRSRARSRSRGRLEDRPFTVASVETRAHTERPEGAVHHVDAAAGGGPQARLQRGAHDARRPGPLRARPHHLHADRLARRSRRRRSARRATRSARCTATAYLPDQPREYRSKVKNAQEAHEAIRPAGDRMRTVDDVDRELSGSDERRLYDLIWKRTVASQMADARIRRVTLRLDGDLDRRRGGDVPGDGPHHRVPRLPPRLRRGRRRPRRRARGPRDDPAAARRRRDGRVPRAPAVGPHHAAAGALHRGEPGEGARGARHRSAVHVRVGDRDDPRPRLRVEEGHRARPDVDGVRQGAAARALLRPPHRLRVHRDDGGGARRHRARRGRSREVAPLLLLRQRPGRAARPRGRGAPRADRQGRGQRGAHRRRRARAASSSCGCGPTAPTSSAATRRRPVPADLAPDELTPEKAEELLAMARRSPRARHRSRHRPHRARAHRPLRPVRAARRAGAGHRRRSPSGRRCSRRWTRPRSRSSRRSRCSRCRASSASTPTASRSPRRTAATGPTSRRAPTAAASIGGRSCSR